MAGVGGRAFANLSRHLARLRLYKATRTTQGHAAAFLHTTQAMDAGGIFDMDDDDETGSYTEGLLQGLTDISDHYTPDTMQNTPYPATGHRREAQLGGDKEEKEMKHSTGVSGVLLAPVVSDSVTQGGGVTEINDSIMTGVEQVLIKETQYNEETFDLDQQLIASPSIQNDQLESINEEKSISTPIETVSPIDPHPIDLTSEPTQEVTEKNANIDSSFDVTQECYEASEVEVANQTPQNDYQGRERWSLPQPPPGGGGGGGADSLSTSSVPEVPDDTKDVKVGTMIALMVAEGEDWKTAEMPASVEGDAPSTTTEDVTKKAATPGEAGHGNYGPSVRLLLEQYGLSEGDVPHGGPHGILVKGDVLRLIKERNLKAKAPDAIPPPEAPQRAAAQAPPPPAAPTTVQGNGYVDVEVTSMRRTIAKRLTQSKGGIAHSYATMECCMNNLLALRQQYKAEGISVSVNDLVIKAVAVALAKCPEMNCVWQGDQLKVGGAVDVSVAVATPAGLITPIVRDADTRGLEDIAATVRDLATRAKDNKLKLDEFQGGTFTISNLGMFGIREFSAIINPPQCGILAVGGSRLVPDESGVPLVFMASQLSYDRAAVDDLVAAEFLGALKSLLEDPKTILLGSYASQPHPLSALL